MKIKLLRLVMAASLVAAPFALSACGAPCDDVAGSTVLADDDDCGDDD